jgi:hypothetical protein
MSSLRKFHSIAALCGDGLRPELQALFERLAVDPRTELFARDDGMVQSGPDPIAAEGSPHKPKPATQLQTAPRTLSPGNFSFQTETLPRGHSFSASKARVIHGVVHRDMRRL